MSPLWAFEAGVLQVAEAFRRTRGRGTRRPVTPSPALPAGDAARGRQQDSLLTAELPLRARKDFRLPQAVPQPGSSECDGTSNPADPRHGALAGQSEAPSSCQALDS